ncbi:biotin transport system permease protein [Halorientalis persicus]|jgi:biotin transport system permease protein|uniref:Biotin transport system permease protein n=1 Tax=Halorientalis persicus TaxID=1367881 RepID=A0A1H8UZD3_9EURY|nr:CbiQ family ECF transporter T component [Halorientalis persicus]SEP08525.1 biotin transport system permease protein [Halorientalis persicus]
MLSYEPGTTFAHALDPRTKLAFQAGFAVAAFAYTTPRGLAILSALALAALAAARRSPLAAAYDFRFAAPILLAAPLLEGLVLGPPWFSLAQARFPALASYRVVLLLLVSAAYVYTTSARDSRAAIQWLVPGRPGRFLGLGVAVVFRFLPVLVADLRRARAAMQARLGTDRSLAERIRIVTTAGLRRVDARADALALALQARCVAWNPTLPRLALSRRDAPVLVLALALAVSPLL